GISPKAITEPYETHMKRVLDLEKQANNIVKSQVRVLRDLLKDSSAQVPEDVKATLQKIRLNQMPDERQLSVLMPRFEPTPLANLKEARAEAGKLRATTPTKPEFAMALADSSSPITPKVFVRGNPNNQGQEVPRRF